MNKSYSPSIPFWRIILMQVISKSFKFLKYGFLSHTGFNKVKKKPLWAATELYTGYKCKTKKIDRWKYKE